MHFIVACSTMFSKGLKSRCQRRDKYLPIPAIFHNTPLKGRRPCVHRYVRLLHFFIKLLRRPQKEPVAEAFVSFVTDWNMMKSLVWNTNTSLKRTVRKFQQPYDHTRGIASPQLGLSHQRRCVPPTSEACFLFPASLFDLRLRLHRLPPLSEAQARRCRTEMVHVDHWGHNDGLSLFAAAPVGWRGTMSIIWGVLSDGTGAVTFYANLWRACVNLWLWSRFAFVSVQKLIERYSEKQKIRNQMDFSKMRNNSSESRAYVLCNGAEKRKYI